MSRPDALRADIQGLRALAVLAVLAFHASAGAWLPGGFVGVDVFFVISGFLITGLLLKANAEGRLSLVDFYRRRVRRLFPALLVVLIATLAAGAALLPAPAYRDLAAATVATLLFVSNLFFMGRTSYFDPAVEYNPLLHTWSLAVEEQFYILFPIALVLLWRLGRGRVGPVLLVSALGSLGLSVWMGATHPTTAFYFTPNRAFELLIGALAACYPQALSRLGQRARDGLSLLGLTLIGLSLVLINSRMAIPGAVVLVPCLGTMLVLLAGQAGPTLGGRLISVAPLRRVGDMSYSLYLWHWPLLAFARNWALGPLSPGAAVAVAVLSLAVAYASWRWVEQPVLRGLPRLNVLTVAGGALVALGLVCTALVAGQGLPDRFDARSRILFAAAEDYNRLRPRCHRDEATPIAYDDSCLFGAPGAAPTVAIWSDSHGAELTVALGERLAREGRAVMQITSSLCPPALDYPAPARPGCAPHNADTLGRLVADPRIGQVILLADFGVYREDLRPAFDRGFARSVRALTAAGKAVVIFEPIPVFAYDAPTALGLVAARGGDPALWGESRAAYHKRNAAFIALVDQLATETGARVIRTRDLLCGPSFCPAYAPGEGVLYFNADHVSVTGARRLAAALPLPAR